MLLLTTTSTLHYTITKTNSTFTMKTVFGDMKVNSFSLLDCKCLFKKSVVSKKVPGRWCQGRYAIKALFGRVLTYTYDTPIKVKI